MRLQSPFSLALVCVAAALSGCAIVGSTYTPPASTVPDTWVTPAEEAFAPTTPPSETWWDLFNDSMMSALVEEARGSNLTIQAAAARIRQARAIYGVARSERLPSVAATGGAYLTRESEAIMPVLPETRDREGTYFQIGVAVGWELDLWGRIGRSIESAEASFEATREDYRDTLVLLSADVASTYASIRSLQSRTRYAETNAAAQADTLQLTQDRFDAGLVPQLDVRQAELNLAATRSKIPFLRASYTREINRLGVLMGKSPRALHPSLSPPAPVPVVPASIGIGIPADLIRRRPDVRSAERSLAAQHAATGAAEGERFPVFTIPGTFDLASFESEDLFDDGSLSYELGAAFRWSLYEGGRITETIRAEEEGLAQARLSYEQTVLRALEDVESAISGVAESRQQHAELVNAVEAAEKSVELVKNLYREGLTNFQNVLDMERSLAAQQDALASSEGTMATSAISLYRALGGGWASNDAER